MEAFCERVQAHPHAGEVAASLDGVYRFVIDPSGPVSERHSYDVAIRSTGAGAQASVLDGGGDPRLTVTADYDRWRQLILGELDIGMAVLLRRVKVSGDLSGLAGRAASAQPLLQSLSSVETRWPPDDEAGRRAGM